MIGIYRITNPNGRIYIGQSINIERRFKEYKYLHCKESVKLYNSLKKHGVDNHSFEILQLCSVEELNNRERYFQDLFDASNRKNLNCILTTSDTNSGKMREETKLKISISNTGKKRSLECRERTSKRMKGRIVSQETLDKISKIRAIKVIDTNTGIIYNSCKEAALVIKVDKNHLSRQLKGTRPNYTTFKYYKACPQ